MGPLLLPCDYVKSRPWLIFFKKVIMFYLICTSKNKEKKYLLSFSFLFGFISFFGFDFFAEVAFFQVAFFISFFRIPLEESHYGNSRSRRVCPIPNGCAT